MKLAPKLIELAEGEEGVEEIDGTNCGPRVDEYKAATNLPPHESWPWCAAFICWLVREAMAALGGPYTFKRPTTAGAWDLENWSHRQDESTETRKTPGRDIQPGDILCFTFSHTGLAISKPDADGWVRTIEGNTDKAGSRDGGGVWRKTRHISKIRSRIRFTV
jgi:hypothetical protein